MATKSKRAIPTKQMSEIRRSWVNENPVVAAAQFEKLQEAASESSISGQLRQAIHSSGRPVSQIAKAIGLDARQLGEWLKGERNLRSDLLDRIGLVIEATITVSVAKR